MTDLPVFLLAAFAVAGVVFWFVERSRAAKAFDRLRAGDAVEHYEPTPGVTYRGVVSKKLADQFVVNCGGHLLLLPASKAAGWTNLTRQREEAEAAYQAHQDYVRSLLDEPCPSTP